MTIEEFKMEEIAPHIKACKEMGLIPNEDALMKALEDMKDPVGFKVCSMVFWARYKVHVDTK